MDHLKLCLVFEKNLKEEKKILSFFFFKYLNVIKEYKEKWKRERKMMKGFSSLHFPQIMKA